MGLEGGTEKEEKEEEKKEKFPLCVKAAEEIRSNARRREI